MINKKNIILMWLILCVMLLTSAVGIMIFFQDKGQNAAKNISDRPVSTEEASISAEEARDVALKNGGQKYLDSHPNAQLGLIRLYDTQAYGLIWTVVFSSSSGEWFDIFVDAKTGEVVQKRGPFFPSL